MKETKMTNQPLWPSKLDEGDMLFAIVDASNGEVPYLIYSSMAKQASYVRDSGGWQQVGESFFEKLEDKPLFYVEDVTIDAIGAYDKSDAKRIIPSIIDLSSPSDLQIAATPGEFTAEEEVDALIASVVIAEERELADALIEITQRYGKFNSDDTGVWAGYESAKENENADVGVKCANCILYEGGTSCKIIATEVEPGGYCRFALIPDGVVTAAAAGPAPKKDRIYGSKTNKPGSADGTKKIVFSAKVETALKNKVKEHNAKVPKERKATLRMLTAVYRRGAGAFSSSHRPGKTRDQWAMARVNAYLKLLKSGKPANPKYKQDNDLLPASHPKASNSSQAVTAAVQAGGDEQCPPATADVALNLRNRRKAIRVANYGPLNPNDENPEYWKERAAVWSVSPEEAKNSLCGNCAMFSITTKIRQCIADGIASGGSGSKDAWDAIDQAELGYCEAFDFKCAASRTCDAWVTGGPITDEPQAEKEAQ